MKLTDLMRPWIKETYKGQLWLQNAVIWSGAHIKNSKHVTIAIIDDNVPHIETFRSVRSKTRQLTADGSYQFNYNRVDKKLYPSDPEFFEALKRELDIIIETHGR